MIETAIRVPYHRPDIGDQEIAEVVDTLRSGWLTSGPKVRRLEQEFARSVGAKHAIAVNSATAALHLAIEALKLKPRQAVLVPTMTFAATAEVVLYQGAIPLLVDCDPLTCNMDLPDAARKLAALRSGRLPETLPPDIPVTGIIPVHVGGYMMDVDAVKDFAATNGLWVVEDAAHAFPAAWTREPGTPSQWCGQQTAAVTCFSFYANKTITTGEGGMAVTDDYELDGRMRRMALHGLSDDAWGRYMGSGNWDYQILAPGYKYNLTDIAASVGIHQLAKAEEMRRRREAVACRYLEALNEVAEIELPPASAERIHSWHLFPIKLRLDRLTVNRNRFMEELKHEGVGCSVHWRPLHLHPYYQETFGWEPQDFPISTALWERLVSLPIFPGMQDDEVEHVTKKVRQLCLRYRK
jgi:dTDP-4-amino-4,6-dideoxygalactose transaminase